MKPMPVHSAELSGTAVGTLRLWATPLGLRRVDFEAGVDPARLTDPPSDDPRSTNGSGVIVRTDSVREGTSPIAIALQQLVAYFEGRFEQFDVPLDLDGYLSAFQKRVYERLQLIPFGQIATYGRVAQDIGEKATGAARAVGQAIAANPVPIVIPCHRVVGADGRLTGFSGGPERKAALLELEGVDVQGALANSRVRPDVLRLPL